MDMAKKLLTALASCAGVCGMSCACECPYNAAGTCDTDKIITVRLPEVFFKDLQTYFTFSKIESTAPGETVCLSFDECAEIMEAIKKGAG